MNRTTIFVESHNVNDFDLDKGLLHVSMQLEHCSKITIIMQNVNVPQASFDLSHGDENLCCKMPCKYLRVSDL